MTSLNLIYSNMACGSDEQAGGLGWPRQSCSLCSPASPLLSAPSPFQVPREARGAKAGEGEGSASHWHLIDQAPAGVTLALS